MVQPVSGTMSKEILRARSILDNSKALVYTPLKRLDNISKLTGKEVFIKDESRQISGSFKVRGVGYSVFKAMLSYLEKIKIQRSAGQTSVVPKPYYIVTQTDGNHGIAMIEAVSFVVQHRLKKDPELSQYIKLIEPKVFSIKHLPEVKKIKMFQALDKYRQAVGSYQKGSIDYNYEDYLKAKLARMDFMDQHKENAVYLEHGGFNISCGHAGIGLEIDEQLEKMGIGKDKKVTFIVPVGAGGPVGMIAGLKLKRPNAIGVIVQTNPYSALIRSLRLNTIVRNAPNSKPTFVLNNRKIIFEDGIAVDAPEKSGFELAKRIVDLGLIVDPQKSLHVAAPLLYLDLCAYPDPVVGGTTSATLQAVLQYPNIKAIKEADVIVLLGAEENVDPDIKEYIKSLSLQIK